MAEIHVYDLVIGCSEIKRRNIKRELCSTCKIKGFGGSCIVRGVEKYRSWDARRSGYVNPDMRKNSIALLALWSAKGWSRSGMIMLHSCKYRNSEWIHIARGLTESCIYCSLVAVFQPLYVYNCKVCRQSSCNSFDGRATSVNIHLEHPPFRIKIWGTWRNAWWNGICCRRRFWWCCNKVVYEWMLRDYGWCGSVMFCMETRGGCYSKIPKVVTLAWALA